jgi:hypothetical protein
LNGLLRQVTLGTLAAAKEVAAAFDCLSFGNIALALRIERHLIIRRRTGRSAARTRQVAFKQQEQQKNYKNDNE